MRTLVTLVVSFGICWGANVVSSTFNTSRNFVEARRGPPDDRDAFGRARVWARRGAPHPALVVVDDDGHVSIARGHQIRAQGVLYTP